MKNLIVLLTLTIFGSSFLGCGSSGAANFTVGGTVTGLAGTAVLQMNGGYDLTLSEDGAFTFSAALADGTAYEVTVLTQPSDQVCNLTNASSTIAGANVTSVLLGCHDSSLYSVGGTVSGLSGTVVLQDNGVDDLSVTASGSFTFVTALADGAPYSVSVATQPEGQTCMISNGDGLISGASVTAVSVACGSSGSLDTTFGGDGIVRYDGGGSGADVGHDITTDNSGKIVVVGGSYVTDGLDMAIWRYNSDGTPDTAFGTNGVVMYDSGGAYDYGKAVVMDANDNIVACGRVMVGEDLLATIWRYTSAGVLDATFNAGGIVQYSGASGYCEGVTIDSEGRILTTGYVSGASNNDLAVWRYNTDGSADNTFGTNGIATYDSGASDLGFGVMADSGDNVIVGGTRGDSAAAWKFKYADGSLDGSFGNGGFVTASVSGRGDAATLDSIEDVFVAGYVTSADAAVWKFAPGGTIDTTFGTDGMASYSHATNNSWAKAVVTDTQDRIVAAGADLIAADENDIYVWRFTAGGALDTNFNSVGYAAFDGGGQDNGHGVALDSNGKILVVGSSNNGNDADMVILRYWP